MSRIQIALTTTRPCPPITDLCLNKSLMIIEYLPFKNFMASAFICLNGAPFMLAEISRHNTVLGPSVGGINEALAKKNIN